MDPEITTSPSPVTNTISPAPNDPQITRRSGWSSFFFIVGCICLLGVLATIFIGDESVDETKKYVFITCGIVGAIQSFFLAFLVDVFTDIRWFLKNLVEQARQADGMSESSKPLPPK